MLGVYTGDTIADLIPIGNDDMISDETAMLSFMAVAGQTYSVVADTTSSGGDVVLQFFPTLPPIVAIIEPP